MTERGARYLGILLADAVVKGELEPLQGEHVATLLSAGVAAMALAEGLPEDTDLQPYFETAVQAYNETLLAMLTLGGKDAEDPGEPVD